MFLMILITVYRTLICYICELFTVPFLVTLYHDIAWSYRRHNDAIEVKKRIVQNRQKDLMWTIASGHRSLLGFLINVAKLHTILHMLKFAYS